MVVAMVFAFCLQSLAMRLEVTAVGLSITIILELYMAFVCTDDTTGMFNFGQLIHSHSKRNSASQSD